MVWLRGRGLDGVKLIVGDNWLGMLEAVGEVFPGARYQRCTVHFYRNIFSVVPKSKVKIVAKMLKAIHAQESKKASREKAKAVVAELRAMKLKEAAKKVEDGIEETLTYCNFPGEHWTRIRTNNAIERLNREIRRRTRVVWTFPDGNSALMLVCARLLIHAVRRDRAAVGAGKHIFAVRFCLLRVQSFYRLRGDRHRAVGIFRFQRRFDDFPPIRATCCRTRITPTARSMSSHFNPSSSPRRRPVASSM